MKSIKLFLASLFLFVTPAFAVSTGTDYSDLWWNPGESGWGVNLAQQEKTLFATMYIFGPSGAPTWFSGVMSFSSINGAGDSTFTGKLYSTTGTPYTVLPFIAASSQVTEVGTISFIGLANGAGILAYTVNGVTYTKSVSRTTFAQPAPVAPNVATAYRGSISATASGFSSDNGSYTGDTGRFDIYISGTQMRLVLYPEAGITCTYAGTNYTQEGRNGKATLTGRCTDHPASLTYTVLAKEVQLGATTFSMLFRTSNNINGGVEVGTWVGAKQ